MAEWSYLISNAPTELRPSLGGHLERELKSGRVDPRLSEQWADVVKAANPEGDYDAVEACKALVATPDRDQGDRLRAALKQIVEMRGALDMSLPRADPNFLLAREDIGRGILLARRMLAMTADDSAQEVGEAVRDAFSNALHLCRHHGIEPYDIIEATLEAMRDDECCAGIADKHGFHLGAPAWGPGPLIDRGAVSVDDVGALLQPRKALAPLIIHRRALRIDPNAEVGQVDACFRLKLTDGTSISLSADGHPTPLESPSDIGAQIVAFALRLAEQNLSDHELEAALVTECKEAVDGDAGISFVLNIMADVSDAMEVRRVDLPIASRLRRARVTGWWSYLA